MVHESGFTIILFDIGSAATIETIAGREYTEKLRILERGYVSHNNRQFIY